MINDLIPTLEQVEQIKRDAKRTKRVLGITHSEALERHARQRGFSSWANLMRHANARNSEEVTNERCAD